MVLQTAVEPREAQNLQCDPWHVFIDWSPSVLVVVAELLSVEHFLDDLSVTKVDLSVTRHATSPCFARQHVLRFPLKESCLQDPSLHPSPLRANRMKRDHHASSN